MSISLKAFGFASTAECGSFLFSRWLLVRSEFIMLTFKLFVFCKSLDRSG